MNTLRVVAFALLISNAQAETFHAPVTITIEPSGDVIVEEARSVADIVGNYVDFTPADEMAYEALKRPATPPSLAPIPSFKETCIKRKIEWCM